MNSKRVARRPAVLASWLIRFLQPKNSDSPQLRTPDDFLELKRLLEETSDVWDLSWALRSTARVLSCYLSTLDCLTDRFKLEATDLTKFVSMVVSCESAKEACRLIKRAIAEPACRLFRTPRSGVDFFSGKSRRWLARWLLRASPRKLLFIGTSLQLKRVAFPVPGEMLDTELEAHRDRLVSESRLKEQDFRELKSSLFSYSFRDKSGTLCYTLEGRFPKRGPLGWRWSFNEDKILNISTRSCVESSRGSGGQLGYFLREYALSQDSSLEARCRWDPDYPSCQQDLDRLHCQFDPETGSCEPGCLLSDSFLFWSCSDPTPYSSKCKAFKKHRVFGDVPEEFMEPHTTLNGCEQLVEYGHPGLYLRDLVSVVREKYLRRPIGLVEPLKVRVIAPTHYEESTLWSGFQKQASRHHRKFSYFLSGKELDSTVWSRFVSDLSEARRRNSHEDDWVIVSDDASAATDSIDPKLSAWLIENHIKGDEPWKSRLRSRGRASIGADPDIPCYFQYPGRIGSHRQVCGQPMGDRKSFEILQEIHFIVKRAFLVREELWYSGYPVRINGDDGLIYLPRHLVQAYFDFIEKILWDINRSKTYVHPNIFSFNSALFRVVGSLVEPQPIIRWNLIHRIDKYGNKVLDPRVWNIIWESCPEHGFWLWRKFLPNWKEDLLALSQNVKGYSHNWNLPLSCGGLGLYPVDQRWFRRVTRRQWYTVSKTLSLVGRGNPRWRTGVSSVSKPREYKYGPALILGGSRSVVATGVGKPVDERIATDERTVLVPRFLPRGAKRMPKDFGMWVYDLPLGLPEGSLQPVAVKDLAAELLDVFTAAY